MCYAGSGLSEEEYFKQKKEDEKTLEMKQKLQK